MEAIVRAAKKDDDLKEKLLRLGAETLLRSSFTVDRRPQPGTAIVLPAEAGRIARQKFMERYTLFGGSILLADATRKDLADSARQHDAQSKGHDMAAAFEREVAKRLPINKKVKDVFTDTKLSEIKRNITNGGKVKIARKAA